MKARFLDKRFIVVVIALVGAALACSAPSVQSEVTPSAAVAEAFTNTPFVVTATPEALVVTATTAPSGSSATTGGSGGTTGGSGGTDCQFDSVYVADLTIPDGTELTTGSAFTKTWRIQNNGCQVWPNGTSLIFVSGDQMSGPSGVPVPQTAVGGTQDISVNMTAPGAAGDAQGKWQLRTPDGIQFGDQLTVKIKAKAPAAPEPTDTSVPPAPGPTATLHLVPLAPLLPLLIANFTATYGGTKASCAGPGTDYWVKVKNIGGLILESSYSKLEAPPGTQKDDSSSNSPFRGSKSCDGGQSSLDTDNSAWLLAATTGPAIASGTSAKITIKLCGLDDQSGICSTKTVTFTID